MENAREDLFRLDLAAFLRAAEAAAIAGSAASAAQTALLALTTIGAVFVGGLALLNGAITPGILTAAVAYQTQFTQRAVAALDQLFALRMLEVPIGRLEDLLLSEIEPEPPPNFPAIVSASSNVSAHDVCFRYDDDGPAVIKGISFDIGAGEHVAITGPSGTGKSTLLKLLCGVYQPTSGLISISGIPLTGSRAVALRGEIGVVMQGDPTIAGSIAENVASFAAQIDLDRVWECLALAELDREITALPNQLATFIGEMGPSLSGGQQQRLLLARALYRKPKVLILDEATSNLDADTEQAIMRRLATLDVTKIAVTHRPISIAAADRCLRIHEGKLITS
jgi:ATP-binding cassette subfamily B protein RaxB